MGKHNILPIAADHFATLKNDATKKYRIQDFLTQLGVPIAGGIVSYVNGWTLASASDFITGVSIVSALMCAVAVLVFQIRLSTDSNKIFPNRARTLIDQLFANTMWAILFGLVFALALIIMNACEAFASQPAGCICTATVVTCTTHFALIIAMCLKRLNAAFREVTKVQ